MPTEVTNLSTGARVWYDMGPEEAVIHAYRQRTLKDSNWWDYDQRTPVKVYRGARTVACGDWCAVLR